MKLLPIRMCFSRWQSLPLPLLKQLNWRIKSLLDQTLFMHCGIDVKRIDRKTKRRRGITDGPRYSILGMSLGNGGHLLKEIT